MKEKIKKYFDLELKTAIIYTIAGIAAGYISFQLRLPIIGLMSALPIFALVTFAIKSIWKIDKPLKDWVGNLLFFLLIWFVVYTVFYNI